ncbi:amidohydrolase [Spiractinospora alimapuensis]|nr:amidohydrolase family protein [Spiractinospora alimapuensis]QVQ54641.1 amidohydrolase [Spiractinospora alimapuensis]
MDVASLDAIDVHVHVHASVRGSAVDAEDLRDMSRYFRSTVTASTVPEIAAYYRGRNMAAVVFGVDQVGRSDEDGAPSNEEIAEQAALYPDVLVPFASVDPARGPEGVRWARRLLRDHGVRGFKFHPNIQGFHPNDPAVYPLYEVIAEESGIAVFHSGHTGIGAGTRGGGGVRLKYSNPMAVDDVAVDFPDMTIILAHPSFPWQDEALSVALHKPNVHIDLSGWSPKYFPPQLVQYANTLLKHKVLYGSDYPVITPDRWMRDFASVEFRDHVRPLILKENAARILGLTHGGLVGDSARGEETQG